MPTCSQGRGLSTLGIRGRGQQRIHHTFDSFEYRWLVLARMLSSIPSLDAKRGRGATVQRLLFGVDLAARAITSRLRGLGGTLPSLTTGQRSPTALRVAVLSAVIRPHVPSPVPHIFGGVAAHGDCSVCASSLKFVGQAAGFQPDAAARTRRRRFSTGCTAPLARTACP
jgi:hypothetical protein